MELRLDLDEAVYDRLERRASRNDFDSPEVYAEVIIEEVLAELEGEDPDEDVRDRLDDLGYL